MTTSKSLSHPLSKVAPTTLPKSLSTTAIGNDNDTGKKDEPEDYLNNNVTVEEEQFEDDVAPAAAATADDPDNTTNANDQQEIG